MAESSLKFRDNHFSDEGTEAVVPHHHPASSDVPRPIIYDELSETDRNCLLRRERESLVQKLATSVIEAQTYRDDLEKLKERCRRLENTLFGSNANGTVELKDQLKRKYTEVEELYSQQATDRKKINGLELLCKEGERMIHNLCQSVDTLMAESRRTRREFKVDNLRLLDQLSKSSPQQATPTAWGNASQQQAIPTALGNGSSQQALPTAWGHGSQQQAIPTALGNGSSQQSLPTAWGHGSQQQAIPTALGNGSSQQSLPTAWGHGSPVAMSVLGRAERMCGYGISPANDLVLVCYICSKPQKLDDMQQHFTQCESQRQSRANEMATLLGTDTQPFSIRTE